MTTRVLHATDGDDAIQTAAAALRSGELVALPTETVYGLAANALDSIACAKIFEAKSRPLTDPLIVHVPGLADAAKIANFSLLATKLANAFWPGPLTLVVPRTRKIPDLVTAGSDTVAIRAPLHPVARACLAACGFPLAAPSANQFGRISPTTADHVQHELSGRIPWILDGGPCACGLESTIVRVNADSLSILREGPVTREELAKFATVTDDRTTANTPGSMKSHYAPTTPMEIVRDIPPGTSDTALLAWAPIHAPGFGAIEILSASSDLREAAANLYAAMRRLDAAGMTRIFATPVPETGIGLAIMERLRKAAAAHE